MAYRANILILVWLTNVFFKGVCYGLEFFFFFHPFSLSLACNSPEIGLEPIRKGEIFWMNKTTDLSQYGTEKKYRTRISNSMTVTFFSFLNRKSSNTDFLRWCAYHKVVWISVCQFIYFPLLHCFLSSGRNTVRSLRVYSESLGIACVAGVKMGRERGGIWARESARGRNERNPPPFSLARGLAPSIPFPFPFPFELFHASYISNHSVDWIWVKCQRGRVSSSCLVRWLAYYLPSMLRTIAVGYI